MNFLLGALPTVLGHVLGGISGLIFNRGSSSSSRKRHHSGDGGGSGGRATTSDNPLMGALASGENYGPLLDTPLTNTAGAVPTATQSAIAPSRDEFASMALPSYANPKELIQNPFFDDSLQQVEITVPLLSNGGGSQLIVGGTEWAWNLQVGENPVRLRGIRLICTCQIAGALHKFADTQQAQLIGQVAFWELFSQMQIFINNNTILTYTAQNGAGLRPFAYMDRLNDALRHSSGLTADSVWAGDNSNGPLNNLTFLGTDSADISVLSYNNMASTANTAYVYPNRPIIIEIPFSFFNTTHHLSRLTTLRISLIANPSPTSAGLNHFNLFPSIAQTNPGTTPTLVLTGGLVFANINTTNVKVIGMYADLVPFSSATRQQLNLPFANNVQKHEIFMLDWDPFYIPTGSQWTASPFLLAGGTRWDLAPITGIYITTQGLMPNRSFAMMEATMSYNTGGGAFTVLDTLFLPGAITHSSQVRNGTQYDVLLSNDIALSNWGTPGTDSESLANYIYYMDRRRRFDYDNTNTSVNLLSSYSKMRTKNDDIFRKLGLLYSTGETNPKKLNYLALLANQMPDMIKTDNIPQNVNGLSAPHAGQLEGRYFIAPLEGMIINATDITATAYQIRINYKAMWIFRERYHSASYGIGLETSYVDLLQMLTPVEPRY